MAISLPRSKTNIIIAISVVTVLILAGLAIFFFKQYMDLRNNPNAVSQETTNRLVEKVSKLYDLPKDEQPTVAEVKDKDKLKEQAFFAKVENGDYILIYPKAKMAILFREKDNKLINVGPIAIDAGQQGQQASTKVTVKVINGTTKNGQASSVGSTIASKLPDLVTVDQNYGDAKKKGVTKSIVVDVNKNKGEQAQKIAEAIGGTVGDLPAGEDKPDADILVIAGQ